MGVRTSALSPKMQKVPSWCCLLGTDLVRLLCCYARFSQFRHEQHVEPGARLADREGSRSTTLPPGTPKQMAKTGIPHKKLGKTLGSCVTEIAYSSLALMEIINSGKSTTREKNIQINKGDKTQIRVNDFPRVPLLRNRGTPGTTTRASLPALRMVVSLLRDWDVWLLQWSVLHNLAPATNFSPEIVRLPLTDVAIPAFASQDPVALRAELPSLLIIPKLL